MNKIEIFKKFWVISFKIENSNKFYYILGTEIFKMINIFQNSIKQFVFLKKVTIFGKISIHNNLKLQ